ncbi:glutamate decarboxylase [Dictyobacter aurantiacus]|uniref:Glutamate decarboxylase n=1 Tax=Dictyobacter aurantiacus TaxID=1936993 RepID=A0A401ZN91_9CHLR|nr:glutamate decarboxylase [Dictyobacter aurantiacus]GCE08347.1 glutamate decarboxylase [Dictyobacter aurantiacus]
MLHKKAKRTTGNESKQLLNPVYSRIPLDRPIPRNEMPEEEMLPQTAYQIVSDELILDGNARQNLATFVTNWMEPEARQLMADTFDKNMIDKDEYPQTAELERRCVNILANLWHAKDEKETIGCSTIGSSEACMLAGMALKWKWRERQRAAGKSIERPNLVMGINIQICWEKFCRYWDVEPRLVPMEPGRYHLTAEEAVKLCDENTIGVVAIMGSTMDGSYEPIEAISQALDRLQSERGLDIPLHVDAASGGLVAPFIQPDIVWDFRLPRVKSINTSGHKYGLVYPGVGWVVWHNHSDLPQELIFSVNYLGGQTPTFALNFSRPGSQIVAQYYNFVRLGKEGYRRIQQACQDTARYLSGEIARLGPFQLLSDGSDLPVFAFTLKEKTNFTVFDLSQRLRDRGWIVPAYTYPKNLEDLAVMRIVVKDGFSQDMANLLLNDLKRHLNYYAAHPESKHDGGTPGFSHGASHEEKSVNKGK